MEAALCSGPGEAILPLARPSTIPRARAAVKGAKANSFGTLRATSELHQKQMTSVIRDGKKMNTDPYFYFQRPGVLKSDRLAAAHSPAETKSKHLPRNH